MESEITTGFNTDGISKDDLLLNHTEKKYYRVSSIDGESQLSIKYAGWFLNSWYLLKSLITKKLITKILWYILVFLILFTILNSQFVQNNIECETGELFIYCDIFVKDKQ